MFAINAVMGDRGTSACTHDAAHARPDDRRLPLGHSGATNHEET
jgi:hypothetical protein